MASNLACCVCLQDTGGGHTCSSCSKPVHVICGKSAEEGYGSQVLCNNCNSSLSLGVSVEPPLKKSVHSWFNKYPPGDRQLKHKTVQLSKKTKPVVSEKEKRCICITCFKNDKEADFFVMTRRDDSTKKRHLMRHHKELSMSDIQIYNYECSGTDLDAAKKKYVTTSSKANAPAKEKEPAKTVVTQTLIFGNKTQTQNTRQTIGEITTEKDTTDSFIKALETHTDEDVVLSVSHTEHQSESAALPISNLSKDIKDLHLKLDNLAESLRSIKISSSGKFDVQNKHIRASDAEALDGIDWKSIKNIVELTTVISSVRFYPGNAKDKSPSVLRCETCFNLLESRFSGCSSLDPTHIALKGIGKYSGSLCCGLIIDSIKAEQLVSGGNTQWYQMKRNVRQHLGCVGDHSSLHLDALKHASVLKKRLARGEKVTQNLIRIAISVLKSKSAALHFETEIASHVSTGSDMGDLGHSRNHFNEILAAMNVWVDSETASFLSKPLPSSGFPPHFFITADKSTPQRLTNHAIMICLVANGKRTAVPVNSPVVYSAEEGEAEGTVCGSTAGELASQVCTCIHAAFGRNTNFSLKSAWQGTVCDGQYQAKAFGKTLFKEIGIIPDPTFSVVLWDPSHWLNLAILDIQNGKVGQSGTFLQQLVKRARNIHSMFHRGKMLSTAIAIAQSKQVTLKMTQGTCATRFWTSQCQQLSNIIASFDVYAEAFRGFGYNELKEFEILGKDFAMDLCSVVDAMEIVMELMTKVQSLHAPCWKVCSWWPKAKKILQQLQSEDITHPSKKLKQLHLHSKEITGSNSFKGQMLVEGWQLIEAGETDDHWTARDFEDCQQDFSKLVDDIIYSIDQRFSNSVPEMCHSLACIDFEEIVSLLCGTRRNGKPNIVDETALEEYGATGFKLLVTYVCSQEHVASAIEDGVICMEPGLSHVLHRKLKMALKEIVWGKPEIMGSWFEETEKSGKCSELALQFKDTNNTLESLQLAGNDGFGLDVLFKIRLKGSLKDIIVKLKEEAIISSIYEDDVVYGMLGQELCTILDIALAKGGSEAIVESFYSVVKSQQKNGGQSNDNLSLRAKLDWSLPNISQCQRMINEVTRLYIDGSKEHALKKHSLPIIGDKNTYRGGKVLKRIQTSEPRVSFLK